MENLVVDRIAPSLPLKEEIADGTPRLWALGEMLDLDRISRSCLLARTTERRSGRALSQWYGKVLRFLITRSLPRFPVSHPARLAGTFRAGTIHCVEQE